MRTIQLSAEKMTTEVMKKEPINLIKYPKPVAEVDRGSHLNGAG